MDGAQQGGCREGRLHGSDAMTWDASVKALMRFPDLIKQMNENLDWTSDLGDAFVNQPTDMRPSSRICAPEQPRVEP